MLSYFSNFHIFLQFLWLIFSPKNNYLLQIYSGVAYYMKH